jgi:hypothetical protein
MDPKRFAPPRTAQMVKDIDLGMGPMLVVGEVVTIEEESGLYFARKKDGTPARIKVKREDFVWQDAL